MGEYNGDSEKTVEIILIIIAVISVLVVISSIVGSVYCCMCGSRKGQQNAIVLNDPKVIEAYRNEQAQKYEPVGDPNQARQQPDTVVYVL
ncbi:hypothetical protein QR680_014072 [Steinernema hermaphroditum]|uniref:Uncharacterized protein n=1 Tax=Steinernema hermaphroditum TaxID=289476 RepID=A0AA39I966_9BILA|nr:hypothetical protein QR680_014072 [Steinernema hermaphroditum]